MNSGARLWMTSTVCVRHSRISGGAAVMLCHLNAWLADHRYPAVEMEEFRSMLADNGMSAMEVRGTLLIPGFGLREDLTACRDLVTRG